MPLPLLSLCDHTNLWNTALASYYDIYLCDYLTSSSQHYGTVVIISEEKTKAYGR